MKKLNLLFLAILLVLPSLSAINIEVEKLNVSVIMVKDLDIPTIYGLRIKNLGETDNFRIYNLLGFKMEPSESIKIEGNSTREINLTIYPRMDVDAKNTYPLEFRIRASDDSEIIDTAYLRFLDLKNIVVFSVSPLTPDSKSTIITIRNKENILLENLKVKISSTFFEFEEEVDLFPFQVKEFPQNVNLENFKELNAGFYTLKGTLEIKDVVSESEGKIEFSAQSGLITEEESSGWIIKKKTISKRNNGNVPQSTQIIIEKNILSRLFTGFNMEPDSFEREGFSTTYTWIAQLKPGEEYIVTAKTNWLLPLFILILILGILYLGMKYKETDLSLRKKVAFVKTKGGEFALRVTIRAHARKYLEDVKITDRFPAMVQVYEKFGTQTPSIVDEKKRMIQWKFEKMERGENRVLTYVIYSKVGVLGKFALPIAFATYEREGNLEKSESNRTFFIAETNEKK
jgi:hypothetical protein